MIEARRLVSAIPIVLVLTLTLNLGPACKKEPQRLPPPPNRSPAPGGPTTKPEDPDQPNQVSGESISMDYFELGEERLALGAYVQAIEAYELFMKSQSVGERIPESLFRLAILYAIPESALYDPNRSQELLQTLIKDYPTSRHIPEAKLLIRLNEEITKLEHEAQEKSRRAKELSDELERLKEIDLRGTRSRPPDY